MLSSNRTSKLYQNAFRCTLQDLFHRHEDLATHPPALNVPAEEPVIQESNPEHPEPPTGRTETAVPTTVNTQNNVAIVDDGSVPQPGNRVNDDTSRSHPSAGRQPQLEVGRSDGHRGFGSQDNEADSTEHQAGGEGLGQTKETSSVQAESPEEVPVSSDRRDAEIPLPPSEDGHAEAPPHLPRERQSIEMLNRGKVLNKRLLEVSQGILWAFLPKEGSSLIHDVCESFWGSVDDIVRVS